MLNINLVHPHKMSHRDLSRALGETDRIETWLAAVRARATSLMARGETVPGYKLVTRRGTRRWRNEAAALRALRRVIRGSAFKQADLIDHRLKSPARLEKMFAKLGRRAVDTVGEQVSVADNGFVLAREGDPRTTYRPRDGLAQVCQGAERRNYTDRRVSFRPGLARAATVSLDAARFSH